MVTEIRVSVPVAPRIGVMSRVRLHWRRSGLVGLALAWAILCMAYGAQRDLEADGYAILQPALFALAAVWTLAVVVRPTFMTWRMSGATTVVALASRPVGVALTWWTEGTFRSGWSVVIAFVVFPVMAALIWWFWIREVGPWYRRRRDGIRLIGD